MAALADEGGISEVNITNRSEGNARLLLEVSVPFGLNCKIAPMGKNTRIFQDGRTYCERNNRWNEQRT